MRELGAGKNVDSLHQLLEMVLLWQQVQGAEQAVKQQPVTPLTGFPAPPSAEWPWQPCK